MTENLNDKIIIYQSEDGKTQLDVKLEGETVWLTQAQMVELFHTSKQNVSLHINNNPKKTTDESNALFDVVVDYTYTLDTLDKYDILLKSFIYQIYPTPLTHHNRPHSYPYRLTFYMKSFTLYKE